MSGPVRAALASMLAALAFTSGARAVASPNAAQGGAAVAPGAPPVKRFALVVGSNRPPRPGLATLRYADDDAVRWTVLFQTFGAEVELLTDLDAESERLYGLDVPAAPQPHPCRSQAGDGAAARSD